MSFVDMSHIIKRWSDTATFLKIEKVVQDHQIIEKKTSCEFEGIFTVMNSQKVILKPEGQRAWRWWELITTQKLVIDDIIEDYNNIQYRVTAVKDWSQAGFYEYDLTEAYSV